MTDGLKPETFSPAQLVAMAETPSEKAKIVVLLGMREELRKLRGELVRLEYSRDIGPFGVQKG